MIVVADEFVVGSTSFFRSGVARRSYRRKKSLNWKFSIGSRTCPLDSVQVGTVSLTIVVSLDEESESSSLMLRLASVDELGLSFVVEGVVAFDDEHFCRLCMCFKS